MPQLPGIGDTHLLFEFKNDGAEFAGKGGIIRKSELWKKMEKLGDMQSRLCIDRALTNFFGRENYKIHRVVADHANSNAFYAQVSMHYNLHDPTKVPGGRNKERIRKALADPFEAWIGFCVTSRQLFNQDDSLADLQAFFNDLIFVRYYGLRRYAYSPTSNIPSILDHYLGSPDIEDVLAQDLRECFSTSRLGSQRLGYVVTFKVKPSSSHDVDDTKDNTTDNKQILTAFATTIENAKRIRELALWCDQRLHL